MIAASCEGDRKILFMEKYGIVGGLVCWMRSSQGYVVAWIV